jgi:hypothetical protein
VNNEVNKKRIPTPECVFIDLFILRRAGSAGMWVRFQDSSLDCLAAIAWLDGLLG